VRYTVEAPYTSVAVDAYSISFVYSVQVDIVLYLDSILYSH